MGTNFYWTIDYKTMLKLNDELDNYDDLDPKIHIGKRLYIGHNQCSFTWTTIKHKKILEEFVYTYPNLKICKDDNEIEYTASEMLNESDCDVIKEYYEWFC